MLSDTLRAREVFQTFLDYILACCLLIHTSSFFFFDFFPIHIKEIHGRTSHSLQAAEEGTYVRVRTVTPSIHC